MSDQWTNARAALDAHVRDIVDWHFDPATGCPFWLDYAKKLGWDPAHARSRAFDDLSRFPAVRGRMAARRSGAALDSQGLRRQAGLRVRDRRHDRHSQDARRLRRFPHRLRAVQRDAARRVFSERLQLADARPVGPAAAASRRSSTSRSTAAASASASISIRAGSSSSSRRAGWSTCEAYKEHVIDQAVTILQAGHDIRCMFTTPKLLEALALRLESMGTSIRKAGITGIFSGGTEFTPQWNRFAHEELLDGAYMTPTYGNTLMGLAASAPSGPENNYKITYYAPQPRAVIEVVDFDDRVEARRLRPDRPREADDADQGVLRAGVSRARRRRARAARTRSIHGTASAASDRSAASRQRRRLVCTSRFVRFVRFVEFVRFVRFAGRTNELKRTCEPNPTNLTNPTNSTNLTNQGLW